MASSLFLNTPGPSSLASGSIAFPASLNPRATLVFFDKPARFPPHHIPDAVLSLDAPFSGVTLLSPQKQTIPTVQNVTYWFLTDKTPMTGTRQNHPQPDIFSIGKYAHFRRIKSNPYVALWEVQTRALNPNELTQIAAQADLPILGDVAHGGSPFYFLALHRFQVVAGDGGGKQYSFTSPPPRLYERLGLARDAELARLLTAVDRRQRLFDLFAHPRECRRISHDENPNVHLDILGNDVLWASFYGTEFKKIDRERLTLLGWMLGRSVYVRLMQDRGQDPNAKVAIEIGLVPEEWTGEENGLKFLFKKQSGLSAGLFLDQRKNRELVRESCDKMRVLNLFAYTGGFTVAALKGGASHVTHVDLSAVHNDWAKQNVVLNGFKAQDVRWIKENCLRYLDRLFKRGEKFEWILCDPPSFSRDQKTVFRLEKDFLDLIARCRRLLAPGGRLLFSTNYETRPRTWFLTEIRKFLQGSGAQVQILEGDFDFEIDSVNPRLKSFLIS